MRDKLTLLLSCYACEPHRGSEPGVGWAWALGMAKRHETWVLTRANNRDTIEKELDRLAIPESERPHFVWVDLPKWVQSLKKRSIVPVGIYYLLWQFTARRAWDRMGVHVDIIHHVTFCSFVIPGVWWNRREKVVLGPLGGMSICANQYLRCFPLQDRMKEWFRGFMRRLWRFDVCFRKSLSSADFVLFTTKKIQNSIAPSRQFSAALLETAFPVDLEQRPYSTLARSRQRRFVWAGTLAGHKAGDIAIRSFAKAFKGEKDPPCLEMFGEGPDRRRWIDLAKQLGVDSKVRFRGSVAQTELWNALESAIAIVFSSVRDTSGNVVLEALALGTPVICFNHQGVAEIVDNSCGIRVEPRSYDKAVSDFAAAMRRLVDDPTLVDCLGAAGRKRALERFTWKQKFDAVDNIYQNILFPNNHLLVW